VKLASAATDSLEPALAFMPLPPRRPKDEPVAVAGVIAGVVASQPDGPMTVASLPSDAAQPERQDDAAREAADYVKDPVRALLDPRPTLADLGFSSRLPDDLSVTHFSGPAVKALNVVRMANAEL
jgi:hypothetical protein